ncbi:MAG: hypothetical protein KDK90_02135 [Leptospiraceae bacterium]|nr:hypothetical protein [Leptospiraceae bacterium]
MHKKANHIFVIFLTLLQIPLIVYCLYLLHLWFQGTCPNKDFLSWDGDLRFIKTIGMMDSLRDGRIFDFIVLVFDSPTWPILRNLIQVVVFFILGHSQEVDVYITFFTFVLILFLFAHILFYSIEKNKFLYPLLFFLSWNLLLDTRPILVYMFTAMLEVQGGFFFLLTSYYIVIFFQNQYNDKYLLYKLSFSFIALLFTKHPYGYMQVFSLAILSLSLSFKESKLLVIEYFLYLKSNFYKNIQIILAVLLITAYIILGKAYLTGKLPLYIKYSIALLLTLDFYIFLFKNKDKFFGKGLKQTWNLMIWVVLPIVFWILIHPDRFASSSGTLAHIQTEGHQVGVLVERGLDYYLLYFKSLVYDSFGNTILGMILLIAMLFSLLRGGFLYFKYNIVQAHFIYSFLCMVGIMGLTLLTPNHQVRHLYHIYPTLIIIIAFLLDDLFQWNKIVAGLLIIFITAMLSYFSFQNIQSKYSFNLCFTDTNRDVFKLPRWVSENVKNSLTTNSILVNRIDPFHLNKPDTELMMTIHAYNNRVKLLTDPKRHIKNKNGFSSLYVIGNTCSGVDGAGDLIRTTYEIKPLQAIQSEFACIEIYGLNSKTK